MKELNITAYLRSFILFGIALIAYFSVSAQCENSAAEETIRLKNEGFRIYSGSVPMELQLKRACELQLEAFNSEASPYLFADGTFSHSVQYLAETGAMTMAKNQLAGLLVNEIKRKIDMRVESKDIELEVQQVLIELVDQSENKIHQVLTNVKPIFKAYRKKEGGKIEVMLKVFIRQEQVEEQVKEILKEEAEKKEQPIIVQKDDDQPKSNKPKPKKVDAQKVVDKPKVEETEIDISTEIDRLFNNKKD